MGFKDEQQKENICHKALEIIEECSKNQLHAYNDSNTELAYAKIAKTWCDIYETLRIKEVKVNEY